MRAIPKTEQAAAGNSDPFDRKARSKASLEYTTPTGTATIPFSKSRISLRRFAAIRLREIYTIAMYRRREGFVVDGSAFASMLAFTLSCDQAGKVVDRSRPDRSPCQVPWMGLSLETLRRATVSAELGYFEDDELQTIIASVQAWRAEHGQKPHTARQLGLELQLTRIERDACSVTTIEAVDESKADRLTRLKAAKRVRDRERQRTLKVRKPRSRYEAESLSQTKPWEAFGISRRQWERRGKPDVASVSPTIDIKPARHLRHGPVALEQGPVRAGGGSRGVGADGPSPGGKAKQVAACRTGGAAAFGEGGFEVGALTPRPRIADPGEPPLPQLTGRTLQVVAIVEAASDVLATMSDRPIDPTGMTLSSIRETLDGLSDLLWAVAEVDPEGVEETARIVAHDTAEILMVAAANDNRICALVERLAA